MTYELQRKRAMELSLRLSVMLSTLWPWRLLHHIDLYTKAMSSAICHVLNSMNWETQNTSSWRVLKLHSSCPGLFCTSLLRNLLTVVSTPAFARVITSLPRTAQTKRQIHNEFQISKLKSFEHFEGEVESWWAVVAIAEEWSTGLRIALGEVHRGVRAWASGTSATHQHWALRSVVPA